MKRVLYAMVSIVVTLILLPGPLASAQSSRVPITYNGDTDETIDRRVRWIEMAKKEKEVMWWTSIRPNQVGELAAEFNKIYPFIKIRYWRGQDVEREMRIEAEHAVGRVTTDLCDAGSELNYPRWRKMGLTEKFVHIVPELEKINPRRYSKYGDWIQPGNNFIAPMYNTNLVSPAEAPKSWEDLLDPKWKGHIGMTTDPKVWSALALAEGGWGIEKTEAFLKKLKEQNLIWAKGHSAGFTLLIAGEFKIFAENYPRYLFREEVKTAPVDWVRVNPVVITGGTFFLTKNSPHPNAARLFLEWLFSPQGAVEFEKVTGYGSVDYESGTRMGKALRGLNLIFRDEDVMFKTAELSWEDRLYGILGVGR